MQKLGNCLHFPNSSEWWTVSGKNLFSLLNCKVKRADLYWPQFVKILVGVSLSEALLQMHKFHVAFCTSLLVRDKQKSFQFNSKWEFSDTGNVFKLKLYHILLCLWESFFMCNANPSSHRSLHFISFSSWPNNFLIWKFLRFKCLMLKGTT